jgi:predicted HTH domain antitoxin
MAMEAGRLSVKRTAELLGLSLAGLETLLWKHGIKPPFEA